MTILRLLSLPVTATVVALGVWVTGAWISNDFRVSMALTAAWFAIAGAACVAIAWRFRPLRVPVLLGYTLSAAGIGAGAGANRRAGPRALPLPRARDDGHRRRRPPPRRPPVRDADRLRDVAGA